jgi:hypothetical protein
MAAGAGDVVADWDDPEPDPSPFTTIAWRMGHISVGVLGARNHSHFDGPPCGYPTTDWPLDAAGGVAMLDAAYARWIAGVRALDGDGLARPCGPAEGPYAEYPMAALVLHIHREVIHHGAELCLLRDLYRHTVGGEVAR